MPNPEPHPSHVPSAPPQVLGATAITHWARRIAPGLLGAVALAIVSWLLWLGMFRVGRPPVEPIVLALVLGMLIRLARRPVRSWEPGLAFGGRTLLEIGIVLLGASLNFRDLAAGGVQLAVFALIGVVSTIAVGLLVGHWLGLGRQLASLVAVGNAICGNSAIAALAPAIRASKHDIASAIALTATLSVGVVLVLPPLAPLLGLTNAEYGVVVGLAVYAVPQVLAASLVVSAESGEIGTLVKLIRVLLLGPTVAIFAILAARQISRPGDDSSPVERARLSPTKLVPWFVLGFAGFAIARTLGVIPTELSQVAREGSRWLTVVAMAALGLSVDLSAIRRTGPRVIATVLLLTLYVMTLGLALVKVIGV